MMMKRRELMLTQKTMTPNMDEMLKEFYAKGKKPEICIPVLAQGASTNNMVRREISKVRKQFRKDSTK